MLETPIIFTKNWQLSYEKSDKILTAIYKGAEKWSALS